MRNAGRFFSFVLLLIFFLAPGKVKAGIETIPSGSYIVNMGVVPQTVANGLKPYGLVYALLVSGVPVKWVINQSKTKDGIDFTHNGVVYRSGSFIISAEFITPAVTTVVNNWQTQGVVINTAVSSFSVNVEYTLNSRPRWVLDAQKGSIAIPFFNNAGIPSNAYYFKAPNQLGNCDDIYVMPHADPTWATHRNLWYWNLNFKGALWAGCHAVSVLENVNGPDITTPATIRRMNFLMSDGPAANQNALDFGSHNDGTPPYVQQAPTHPMMQFMGKTDLAHQNGSEQIYMPFKGGVTNTWRASTVIGAYDPSQADVPLNSGGPAAAIAFGRAFGDNSRGWVMYEGGHNIANSTSPDHIAAQRAFFNFSLIASLDRQPIVSATGFPANNLVYSNYNYNIAASASSPTGSGNFTFLWSSSCGGSFSNPTSAATTFTPPVTVPNISCVVYCRVTDDCGRITVFSRLLTVSSGPKPPTPQNDVASLSASCGASSVTMNVAANDTDPDGDIVSTVSLVGSGITANGVFTLAGGGSITYTPNSGFVGTDQVTYRICDALGQCTNATFSVNVTGLPDPSGRCNSTQYWGYIGGLNGLYGTQIIATVQNPLNAIGDPDGDIVDNTTYANLNTNGARLTISLESPVPAYTPSIALDTVFIWTHAGTAARTLTVEYSLDSTTWLGSTVFAVNTTDNFSETSVKKFLVPAGTRWIRMTGNGTNVWVDAVQYNVRGCVSASPIATRDVVTTLEDVKVKIDVTNNDYDPQDLPIKVAGITRQPVNGYVSIGNNNVIEYINIRDNPGTGVDSFSYRVCNTIGLCIEQTVVINIQPDGCGPNTYKPFNATTFSTIFIPNSNAVYTGAGAGFTPVTVSDSYLRGDRVNNNYGTATTTIVYGKTNGLRRTILRFDLSSLPTTAIIDSASLFLYHSSNAGNERVDIQGLTRNFVEAQTTWNLSQTGTNWTTAGGDFSATTAATTLVGTTTGVYKIWNMPSLVQNWVAVPATNFGMILRRSPEVGSGTFKQMNFNTREINSLTRCPRLRVVYKIPAACTPIPLSEPFSMPDTVTTNTMTSISISARANDIDINNPGNNAALVVSVIGGTSTRGGVVSVSSNNIQYAPPVSSPRFSGVVDTIFYRVCAAGLCDTAAVYVRLTNAPPIINADAYTLASNTVSTPNNITATVMSNDSDPENNTLSAPTVTLQPKNGIVTVSSNNLVYTPNLNFVGNDTLIYRVVETGTACILLEDTALVVFTVTNRVPAAVADNYTVNSCEVMTFSVLDNDTDPETQRLQIITLNQPAAGNGTVALTNNNTQIVYTPPPGGTTVNNPLTFTYRIADELGGISPTLATVTITIRAVPVYVNPVALRDTFIINRNELLFADILTNDYDPEGRGLQKPVTIITPPTRGTFTNLGNGLVRYVPNAGVVALDSFQYRIFPNITLAPGCLPPSLPNATTWAYIIIQNVPEANWDYTTTVQRSPVVINVLNNDVFGVDGPGSGTITIITPPGMGVASVLNNGSPNQSGNTISYTPPNTFFGRDSLIYQICDANGDCDTAIAYIDVKKDSDADGIPDDIDIDDDNDGITDFVEVCGAGATAFTCTTNNEDPAADTDGDGIPNWKDADWCTLNVAGACTNLDTDGDGIPDYFDKDSDNDGIPDVIEAGGVDANGDGIIDNYCDTDGDGFSQNVDANNTGAAGSGVGLGAPDFDGDGVPNSIDLDSDNDGIPDLVESYGADVNNDGRIDVFADTDDDGWSNQYDGDADENGIVENLAGVLVLSLGDPGYVSCANPGTGRPVCYALRGNLDGQGLPNFLDLDSDGDGITDATESGITATAYTRSMVSGGTLTSGWSDAIRALPALNLRNTDTHGRPDLYDIDSDNDGITDNIEAQPTSSFVVTADPDTDGDGLVNSYDFFGGIGGNGLTPYDHDADLIPDYRDTDADNDGAPDRNEGDKRYEFLSQATIETSGDTDDDGLMDYFDIYNSITPCSGGFLNISMSNMGDLGTFNGPVTGGSSVQLVQSTIGAPNRDWRNSLTLPLQVLQFTGALQGTVANLQWKVSRENEVGWYRVERSIDGRSFTGIGVVIATNTANAVYEYKDDITQLDAVNIYYRIVQVNKSQVEYTTNTIRFKTNEVKGSMQVFPNPVASVATIMVQSKVKDEGVLILTDVFGKTLQTHSIVVNKGSNNYTVADFANLPGGMYFIKLILQQQTFIQKIIKQ